VGTLSVFIVGNLGIWNKLPTSVVEASSVNSIKKRLGDWSKDVEL